MAARKRLNYTESEKDKMKGAQLVNLLNEFAKTGMFNGQPVSSERIAAARAALPFLRPTLAAVEQTTIDPAASVTPEGLLAMLQGLSERFPQLRPLIDAIAADMRVEAQPEPVSEDSAAQQIVPNAQEQHINVVTH